ncbi:hypothetical protein [Mycolicibacterium rhodesiae]|uniref:hypothetical protein n=1 Tax=Mycolicibacterium rhodesiae TaxID=36814 RepID=UPI00022E76EC|nr:hypothetical protein [Mycolicibacterium rhodesiae]
MLPEAPTPQELRASFQTILNLALTRGRSAPRNSGLGPDTVAAIDEVAYEHPDADADADCIAAAYDAFEREHGR